MREFVYLAVILDAWSRRVVGYALSRRIDTRLTLAALRAAVHARHPPPDLIHHSDRATQYAAESYRAELAKHGLVGSMGRRGKPYDNSRAETASTILKKMGYDPKALQGVQIEETPIFPGFLSCSDDEDGASSKKS